MLLEVSSYIVETEVDVGERWAGVISSSVGFAGKDEDELENSCELTMDEVIFNDCFDKTSKLWVHVGAWSCRQPYSSS